MSLSKRMLMLLSCVVLATGCDAYLAGDNSQGQLGTNSGVSGVVNVGPPWMQLEAGWLYNCGITFAKTLWCWGDNGRGQTGNGTTSGDQLTPYQVDSNTDWQQVAPGYRHTCGIRAGQLWCWGSDTLGQLGNGATTTANQGSPVRVGTATDWDQVASGRYHSCAIRTNGDLYCWGYNGFGQIGSGNTTDYDSPYKLISGPWKAVAAGRNHTCGIRSNDNAYCWGSNSEGQIGTTQVAIGGTRLSPLYLVGDSSNNMQNWLTISAGGDTSCGTRAAVPGDEAWQTSGYCWGSNDEGQLGTGGTQDAPEPVLLDYSITYTCGQSCGSETQSYYDAFSVSPEHICGITSGYLSRVFNTLFTIRNENRDRLVKCYGDDTYGQQSVETAVLAPAVPIKVSAGLRHSVLLTVEP